MDWKLKNILFVKVQKFRHWFKNDILPVLLRAFSRALFKLATLLGNAINVSLNKGSRCMTWRSSWPTGFSAKHFWQTSAKIKVVCNMFILFDLGFELRSKVSSSCILRSCLLYTHNSGISKSNWRFPRVLPAPCDFFRNAGSLS